MDELKTYTLMLRDSEVRVIDLVFKREWIEVKSGDNNTLLERVNGVFDEIIDRVVVLEEGDKTALMPVEITAIDMGFMFGIISKRLDKPIKQNRELALKSIQIALRRIMSKLDELRQTF